MLMASPKINFDSKKVVKSKWFKVGIGVLIVILILTIARFFLVAGMVNGVPISRLKIISELEKQGGAQILDSQIAKTLIFQEAKKQKINVSQEVIDGQLKQIEGTLKAQGLTLDEALASRGQTRADLVTQIKIQKIVEAILSGKINISDEEISTYFTANADLYTGQKLEDVKEEIKSLIFQDKLNSEYSKWMEEIKNNSKILLFVNY